MMTNKQKESYKKKKTKEAQNAIRDSRNWFFKIIFNYIYGYTNKKTGSYIATWLSIRFHIWLNEKRQEDNIEEMSYLIQHEGVNFFDTTSGKIAIEPVWSYPVLGKEEKISIGIEWGRYGMASVQMDKDEAIKMCEHINQLLANASLSRSTLK